MENPFFPFWVVPPLALRPVVSKLSEQFPMSPVPKRVRTAVHGTQSRHPRPPLLSPVGSGVRFEEAMPSPVPPAHPCSQVSVAPRTQTLLRDVLPSESALHKLLFRMLMQRRIFQCIRPFNWFTAIDLKDTYFHVSIPPQHRPFLRFAFEGRAYQYKVLPFWHLSRLGLWVNWERSKLYHGQRISFLGMELDSVILTARLSIERAQSMLNCLESFQRKRAVPLKQFQRLLGHMASAAAVTPPGLLHMRPLKRWLHDRVPR